MTEPGFVHLHTHTEYSLLDGAARIEAPKSNPHGADDLHRGARARDARPGDDRPRGDVRHAEVLRGRAGRRRQADHRAWRPTSRPGSRFDRNPGESEEKYYHLTLLAEERDRLPQPAASSSRRPTSRASTTGPGWTSSSWPSTPRASSACRAACPPRSASSCSPASTTRALAAAGEYRDIFGARRLLHRDAGSRARRSAGDPGQAGRARARRSACRWSRRTTCTTRGPTTRSRTTCCCASSSRSCSPIRSVCGSTPRTSTSRAPAEMRRVFARAARGVRHDARDRRAHRSCCPSSSACWSSGKTEYRLPRFDTPAGEPLDSYLRELVERGAHERYGDPLPDRGDRAHRPRARRSSRRWGSPGYFLIVWDLIRFAREQGIRVGPGRGSAAGSVVSYALRITDLDPLRYGLLFERFLNPDRIEMPDIDMDFDERRRDEVIRYATEKYGVGSRRADRHVPDDQGQAGDPRRRPRAGVPAARRATSSARCIRPRSWGATSRSTPRSQTSPELREAYERAARGEGDHRHGPRARGPAARGLGARRRRRDRRPPLVEYLPLKLTKDSRDDAEEDGDAVRHERRRAARPAQDGLPRACGTSR